MVFNENAEKYDAWFDENKTAYEDELAALSELIPRQGTGLEIGTGTGRFASRLGIAVGVEPAARMAALARQRGIEIREAAAEALPFGDAEFDFALMMTSVCFLDDINKAFGEAGRVLKPAGSLIIGFIDRESELGKKYNEKKSQSKFYSRATFYSVREMETHLSQAGFSCFVYRQALFSGKSEDKRVEPGFGSGSFIAVRAMKK